MATEYVLYEDGILGVEILAVEGTRARRIARFSDEQTACRMVDLLNQHGMVPVSFDAKDWGDETFAGDPTRHTIPPRMAQETDDE